MHGPIFLYTRLNFSDSISSTSSVHMGKFPEYAITLLSAMVEVAIQDDFFQEWKKSL